MRVRRVLTETPLARQHVHRVARRGSRTKPIPWATFDASAYPPETLAVGAEAARSLASGEYGAVTLFAHVAASLAFGGAPFDLISAAAAIPADEIRHADHACQMARACGSREPVDVDAAILGERCAPVRTMEDLDALMLDLPAVSETIATALLEECWRGATDPVAAAFYGNIVRDEVHHARLGWYYLAWRAPQWTTTERQRLADRTGEIVLQVRRRFKFGRDAVPEARALGVLDTPRQRRALERVMVEEIVPGLDALGLGASHVWKDAGGFARATEAECRRGSRGTSRPPPAARRP